MMFRLVLIIGVGIIFTGKYINKFVEIKWIKWKVKNETCTLIPPYHRDQLIN